jgi:hypothetical protein
MLKASLSLTDDAGLKNSGFTYKLIPSGAKLLIFTAGVLPIVSRILL